jgi:ABC-type transporter Mla subunit MlaD
MAKERNALRAGAFIAISIILALGVILAITGTDTIFQPSQTRKVVFSLHDDIGGLQPGDPVRIGGFRVGTVRKIDVVQGNGGQAGAFPSTEITITMPRKYVVHENAIIEVNGTLTGAYWLNFQTLGEGKELADSASLTGRPGGMVAIMEGFSDLVPQLQATIAQVNDKTLPAVNADLAKFGATADSFTQVAGSGKELVGKVKDAVEPVVGKFSALTDTASGTLTEFKQVAQHADTDIMPNIAAATGTIKEKLPAIMDQALLLLQQATKAVATAQGALEEAKATFGDTHALGDSVKDVVAGNKSKLDGIINSLKQTADNLKNASVEIRHSPWRLIYKPTPEEMANLNLFDAARQFAEGAGALKDSAQALKDASSSKGLTDEQLKELMDRLNKSFDKFNATEEEFWKAVKQ